MIGEVSSSFGYCWKALQSGVNLEAFIVTLGKNERNT